MSRVKQMPEIEIASRKVGPGQPCLILAEVAQAHDGSLGTAHAFVDAVAAEMGVYVERTARSVAPATGEFDRFDIRF